LTKSVQSERGSRDARRLVRLRGPEYRASGTPPDQAR
jgi:hypothetical protein